MQLPVGCIEFYPLDDPRAAALSRLAAPSLDLPSYLALDLAFPIGRLDSCIAERLPLTPIVEGQDKEGDIFRVQTIFRDYEQAGEEVTRRVIADELTKDIQKQPGLRGTQYAALFELYRTVIEFDRQVFGGANVSVRADVDNHLISPTRMKAPFWHLDYAPGQERIMPDDAQSILPKTLSPLVRGYAFRMVPPGYDENVQPEFVADRDLYLPNGTPHPLIVRNRQIRKESEAFRRPFGVQTCEAGELCERNPQFAAGWREHLTQQEEVVTQMRAEGLIRQARPDEVLLATNFSYHCSKRPTQVMRSLFFGLQIMPAPAQT